MPKIARTIALLLRVLELISAAVVAGLVGHELRRADKAGARPGKRFIYTEVVAGLALLLSILLLLPMTWAFSLWPLDFVMFILWIVAFGLLVDWMPTRSCGSGWNFNPWDDSGINHCQQLKAALAFSFLSAIFWLASGAIAAWTLHRTRGATAEPASTKRRGFLGRRRV